MTDSTNRTSRVSRRRFIQATGALAATGLAAKLDVAQAAFAAGKDTIKVGVIGCGGRGSGAAENVLHAAKGVEIVALADYFQHKADRLRQRLNRFIESDAKAKQLGNRVNVPKERCFSGLDGYEKVISIPDINYIILATSPGFRPIHLQAAVAAGKNVFTEKPVAVDGPGIRTCLEVYEQANQKGVAIAAGTQRRHQYGYIETIKRIHDGAIGDIVNARCYWNGGFIWFRKRQPGMSDLDYQIHNWYHFCWLCGDHIVEQHVHNLDVVNWAMQSHPIRAVGMGGRVRPYSDPNVDGNIFNFFAVDLEYPNGVHVLSMCRQISNCANSVSEALVGTKGTCQVNAYTINGKPAVDRRAARRAPNPYVQEHTDLIESIRTGQPINELRNVAESTLTAILGRTAAYTGKAITWEQVLNSRQKLMPDQLSRDVSLPVRPLPIQARTRFA